MEICHLKMIKFANGVDPDEAAQIDTVINDHEPSRYLTIIDHHELSWYLNPLT